MVTSNGKLQPHNIILTGLPRSGTSLACYLLNKLPNTVALHEPMDFGKMDFLNHAAICDDIEDFFAQMRKMLTQLKLAISRHVDGQVPDNTVGDQFSASSRSLPGGLSSHSTAQGTRGIALRKTMARRGVIKIDKALSSDFALCLKHPHAFTAVLATLRQRFPCYAVIRNPLAVLASWNSIDFDLWAGRAPVAESMDPALAHKLSRESDRLERQLHILAWCFEKYHLLLPGKNLLRYEDLVATGGASLQCISPHAVRLAEKLDNRNKNKLYDRELLKTIGERLLKTQGAYWEFYSKASVESLLNNY